MINSKSYSLAQVVVNPFDLSGYIDSKENDDSTKRNQAFFIKVHHIKN